MPSLSTITALLTHYGYFFLFLLAVVEGPIVAFVVGMLVFLGYLSFVPAVVALFLGDLIPDTIYYYIGYHAHTKEYLKKYTKKLGLTEQREKFIYSMWHTHTIRTLFLSKLAYGLSTVFLITAGVAKYSYRKFIVGTMTVTVLQYGILITLGYYFGSSYAAIATHLKSAGIIVALAALVVVFVGYRKFTKKIAESLIEETI